jgi:hypothetical protein
MTEWFRLAALFSMLFCVVGCSAEDKIVYLSVDIVNKGHQEATDIQDAISENSLNVYLNGNLFRFMKAGFVAGSVDKYLKPGCNSIEIEGAVRAPVEIRLAAYESDHSTISRVILSRKVPEIKGAIRWKETFQIKKPLLLPIFDKNNQSPAALQAEQEIAATVKTLYQACISSNSDKFCRMTLAGYKHHSPAEYQDVRSATATMVKSIKLKPFPGKLHFLHGSNLVCVYSCIVDDQLVLFESDVPHSSSIGSVDFAYIDGHWIVW